MLVESNHLEACKRNCCVDGMVTILGAWQSWPRHQDSKYYHNKLKFPFYNVTETQFQILRRYVDAEICFL